MNNEGSILATDLHPHKLDLIDHNTERLDLNIVETAPIDGRKAPEFLQLASFDAVLVDAPCSGLGVMRRKPDIKYTKREEDLENLQKNPISAFGCGVKSIEARRETCIQYMHSRQTRK